MKKFRRLFAIVAAIAMMCTMVTGLAANTPKIETIQVLNDDNTVATTYSYVGGVVKTADGSADATITLAPSQRLKVAVSMNDGADLATNISAQVTFLSYKEAAAGATQTYDNTTIQYVNQEATTVTETTDDEGTTTSSTANAEFIFRPRASFDDGVYTVKIGGDGITSPSTFTYTVATPATPVTIAYTSGTQSFTFAESAGDVTFTLNGNTVPTTLSEVKLGSVTLTAETDYTYTEGVITVKDTKLDTLEVGTYALSVATTENYAITGLASAIVVTAKQTGVTDEDKATVEGAIDDLEIEAAPEVTDGAVTLPEKVDNTDYAYTYSVPEGTTNVTVSGNKITLAENVPFAKVQVTASVQGAETTSVHTVYIIPADTTVGYGNLGLHSEDGKDIFAVASYDGEEDVNAAFKTAVGSLIDADKLALRADALSIAIYNDADAKAALPHFTDALDYNQDGDLALAEYRIYRKLMAQEDGDEVHTLTNLNNSRQSFIDAAENSAE